MGSSSTPGRTGSSSHLTPVGELQHHRPFSAPVRRFTSGVGVKSDSIDVV